MIYILSVVSFGVHVNFSFQYTVVSVLNMVKAIDGTKKKPMLCFCFELLLENVTTNLLKRSKQ